MDHELACAINRLGAGTIDGVTELVCNVPFLIGLWLGVVGLAWVFDRPRARWVTLGIVTAIAIHAIFTELCLKHALLGFFDLRVRPWRAFPTEILPVGYRFEDSSFPSSHAATTAAIVAVLVWHYPRAWWIGAAFAVAMAFSRVHNGMHYPTDVLAGTILGLIYGALAVWSIERWRRRAPITRAAPARDDAGGPRRTSR